MESRGRTENGLPNTNSSTAGPLSPTGTLRSGDEPLLDGRTPAEGQPGGPPSSERPSAFRRWREAGGDAAGRTDYGGRPQYEPPRQRFESQEQGGWRPGEDWREWDDRYRRRGPDERAPEQIHRFDSREDGRGESGGDERSEKREKKRSWWQRESLTVAEVMTSNVKTVGPDATARDIAEVMKQEDVGVIPVVREDGRLLGLVTDRDLVVRGLTGGRPIDSARAEDLATTDIEVVSARDPLSAIIELMGRQQIRRVPVVDDEDRLVGIVAMADIASRADYHEDLQQALEKISGRRSFWSRIWR